MSLLLCNATLLTPAAQVDRGALLVSDEGRIAYAGPAERAPDVGGGSLNLEGYTLAPGFIDIHTHGGNGIAFGGTGDATGELRAYSEWAAGHGVTAFLCSLAAPNADALLRLVRAYADALDTDLPGAQALGIHLEGPFLNPDRCGAFPRSWLRLPTPHDVDTLIRAGRGWIRMVTLAPELPGATDATARFREAGAVVAMGHTDADCDAAAAALRGPFTHVTHAFNAMRGFHHRDPGALGAVLASDHATAELIADGVHVHPAAMRVLLRCLGPERVVLITDASPWAGQPDGTHEWLGQTVDVRGGRATLPDGGLAGSTATLDRCVRNAVALAGASMADAVRMATLNPARALGVDGRMGQLSVGSDGNLVVLGADGEVAITFVRGNKVYDRAPT
ncbi:MAG: N-acetylglucosamine-6-phosphate deacetylase [Chloroflexi bacterium]|nr:N-acetylglucosamine-6-phosphate deacetylase [Chloroflexota bacterium]